MQLITFILALIIAVFPNTTLAAPFAEPSTMKANGLARRMEGFWQIQNNCGFTIFYTSVDEKGIIVPNGFVKPHTTTSGSYSADRDGLSVKMCLTAGCSNPYQFETTVDVETRQVFYDLSAINGNPFTGVANGVFPSDGSGKGFFCAARSESCAFTNPTNGPVGAAAISAVIIARFC